MLHVCVCALLESDLSETTPVFSLLTVLGGFIRGGGVFYN